MMIPIRCPTCGKPIGHLWEEFRKRVESGEEAGKVLDDLGLDSICCRTVFLGHVDLIKYVAPYKR